jgi:hypothetical protein
MGSFGYAQDDRVADAQDDKVGRNDKEWNITDSVVRGGEGFSFFLLYIFIILIDNTHNIMYTYDVI